MWYVLALVGVGSIKTSGTMIGINIVKIVIIILNLRQKQCRLFF